nr:hypothetical protein [Tanacetum cinerariifolium]
MKIREEEDDIKGNLEDPEECGEDKAYAIMKAIHDKLNDNWFKDTNEEEDDLEGIINYLEPKSYDGFTYLDYEAYVGIDFRTSLEQSLSKVLEKKAQDDLLKFKPKVLVRGSSLNRNKDGILSEAVCTSNSFQVLDDQELLEKEKMEWSLPQIDFFYYNCHKYGLDPSFEDDDVFTEDGGTADEIRPEYEDENGQINENIMANVENLVSNFKTFSLNNVWDASIPGFSMFFVVSKLKMLKKPFRKLRLSKDDFTEKVRSLKVELDRVQSVMVDDCHNVDLRLEELVHLKAYNKVVHDEELFLKQKAKVEWLSETDCNTKFFYKAVKERLNICQIKKVEDLNGVSYFGLQVGDQFVKYFQNVLGKSVNVRPIDNPDDLFVKKLSHLDVAHMVRVVSKDEIKSALFSMANDKSLWPDAFSLKNLGLLLVMKFALLFKIFLQWPIVWCNVLYKCITKVITNRYKGVLGGLVDDYQSAFISSRQISDNILLTQELMRNYHRDSRDAKVAFKIDVQKAYDSVKYSFIRQCLVHFGFHKRMIDWIMNCLSSLSFMISVNGDHYGYFKGQRGLRQGVPLSPYLFALVMEVFSLMIKRRIVEDGRFKYHWRCEKVKLTHLCFANDLLLFCHDDTYLVSILRNALNEFSGISGLVPNLSMSTNFLGNVKENVKDSISSIMPFDV